MRRSSASVWLLTIVLVVVPLGGIALALYGAGRLALRRRRGTTTIDPYEEWLQLRDLVRARRGTKVSQ